jgi:hypothetical protein
MYLKRSAVLAQLAEVGIDEAAFDALSAAQRIAALQAVSAAWSAAQATVDQNHRAAQDAKPVATQTHVLAITGWPSLPPGAVITPIPGGFLVSPPAPDTAIGPG